MKLPSHSKTYLWRIVLILVLVLLGSMLILSEIRVLPLFINVLKSRSEQVISPGSFSPFLISKNPGEEAGFSSFLPYFMLGKAATFDQDAAPELDKNFQGIDFSNGAERVVVRLLADSENSIQGLPIEISFLPGEHCTFGEGYACTYVFPSPQGQRILFASIHSGLGGEADALRNLIEGSGINQALYTADRVNSNMHTLIGTRVMLAQGDLELQSHAIAAIVRIPPGRLEDYFKLPVEHTLEYAVEMDLLDPEILGQELLVFETCGWPLPDDDYVPGLEYTSYSVYLIVIKSFED